MQKTRSKSLALAAISIYLALTANSVALAGETWECALDLQQGDKGSLSLERTQDSVVGAIKFDRNDNQFEQEVEGQWRSREVNLTRYIDANSSQKMHAIAMRVGTKQVKMGGRFDERLTGVWSADCALIASDGATGTNNQDSDASVVMPSTSFQVSPFRPSSTDHIEFTAKASHPDGVDSVALLLNDKMMRSCDGDTCSHTHPPLADGIYNWHVIATSKTGVKNTKSSNPLVVKSSKRIGACTISGLATGPAVAQSTTVEVQLSGEGKRHTSRFDAGVYSFSNIPAGDYTLSLNISPESGLLASPSTAKVDCRANQAMQQNFQFN